MKNKLIYIADIRLPTEKAHGIQIMKMCEAFAGQGLSVELWVPRRHTPIKGSSFDYYQVKDNFSIKYLPCVDLTKFGRIGFFIQSLSFMESVVWRSLFQTGTLFFTRDSFVALSLRLIGKKISWESHMGHLNLIIRILVILNTKIVVITRGLADFYLTHGVSRRDILVSPDAVDIKQFDIQISKEEARQRLSLPVDKNIILYTGHLYDWKGAHVLAEAAKYLSVHELVVFVGGTEADITSFSSQFSSNTNISILGKKPHRDIPMYLKAADILALPNSAKKEISALFTSPMKLFEYMAAERPTVASNLPSLREILNESNAIFAKADDPVSLAEAIKKLIEDKDLGQRLAEKARTDVNHYTWGMRVKNILNFIS